VPRTTQQTLSGAAHVPALHQDVSAWCAPSAHGQHVGAQSSGPVQGEPLAPVFHWPIPLSTAQVLSTFSPRAASELSCMSATGPELQTADGGALCPELLCAPELLHPPARIAATTATEKTCPMRAPAPWCIGRTLA
jgi:hypothetical protein